MVWVAWKGAGNSNNNTIGGCGLLSRAWSATTKRLQREKMRAGRRGCVFAVADLCRTNSQQHPKGEKRKKKKKKKTNKTVRQVRIYLTFLSD
jgi:hypothetical protein